MFAEDVYNIKASHSSVEIYIDLVLKSLFLYFIGLSAKVLQVNWLGPWILFLCVEW